VINRVRAGSSIGAGSGSQSGFPPRFPGRRCFFNYLIFNIYLLFCRYRCRISLCPNFLISICFLKKWFIFFHISLFSYFTIPKHTVLRDFKRTINTSSVIFWHVKINFVFLSRKISSSLNATYSNK